MGKRTHLLLTLVVSLVAAAIGSVAAVATTVEPALACSIAAPYVEVRPAENLRPGQQIEIVGWSFYDIEFDGPLPLPPTFDSTLPDVARPEFPDAGCDFILTPLGGLDVTWQGASRALLGRVDGPDFALNATVPANAATGSATITVGPATARVRVGPTIAPPPCPLYASPDATVAPGCPGPDPWPCPLFEAQAGTAPQPAPGAVVAPGFAPPCPAPCPDDAHTIDQAAANGYSWDCPNPCGYPEANPGAAEPDQAVWCPPPDPCPVYVGPAAAEPDQAVWCPPPDPCPVYVGPAPGHVDADGADDALAVWDCPDPCGLVGGDAVWCPPPCSYAVADEDQAICPVPLPDPPASASTAAAAAAEDGVAIKTGVAPPPAPFLESAVSVEPAASLEPALDVYRLMSHRLLRIAHIVRAILLG